MILFSRPTASFENNLLKFPLSQWQWLYLIWSILYILFSRAPSLIFMNVSKFSKCLWIWYNFNHKAKILTAWDTLHQNPYQYQESKFAAVCSQFCKFYFYFSPLFYCIYPRLHFIVLFIFTFNDLCLLIHFYHYRFVPWPAWFRNSGCPALFTFFLY